MRSGNRAVKGANFSAGRSSADDLRQVVERQKAVDEKHVFLGDAGLAAHLVAQILRHRGVDLQPDDRSAPAALQRGFEQANEIFRLFFDLDVGVADDAEGAAAFDADSPGRAGR